MDYMNSKFGGSEFEPRMFLKFLLDGNEDLANDVCSLIEDWNDIGAFEKVQRIGRRQSASRVTATEHRHRSCFRWD